VFGADSFLTEALFDHRAVPLSIDIARRWLMEEVPSHVPVRRTDRRVQAANPPANGTGVHPTAIDRQVYVCFFVLS
jgi:hypothetical protein